MPAAIMDAPEDILIDRQVMCWHAAKESQKITSAEENCANMLSCKYVEQVYRDWTVSRTDLVTERPKRQRLQASIAALLEQPALTLPSPLMSLFQKRLIAGPSPTSDKGGYQSFS